MSPVKTDRIILHSDITTRIIIPSALGINNIFKSNITKRIILESELTKRAILFSSLGIEVKP